MVQHVLQNVITLHVQLYIFITQHVKQLGETPNTYKKIVNN